MMTTREEEEMHTPPQVIEMMNAIADCGEGRTIEQIRAAYFEEQPSRGKDVAGRFARIEAKLDATAQAFEKMLEKTEALMRQMPERKLEEKLEKITALLIQQKTTKEWYSTADVAERLVKAEFTVREWCRLGHCKAEKKKPYRGGMKQWMIPHDELLRLESDGPAPLGTFNHSSSRN